AGRRVERIEIARERAREDALLVDGGRRVDVAAGPVRPAQLPARGAERIDLAVGRADVDAVVPDGGGRIKRPKAAEPLLGRRLPDELAGLRVQRVDVMVVGAEVDAPTRERDRALDLVAGLERPARRARCRAERVELPGPVADVTGPVVDERR